MKEHLFNFFKYVFIIFLFLLFMVKAHYFINYHLHEDYYPTLFGYYYYKVDDNLSYEKYNENEYLITKEDKNIDSNDYIIYLNDKDATLLEVKKIEEEKYICIENNNEVEININDSNIKGKVIYSNETISKIICFLVNPIVVIIMLLYCIFISQFIYKRTEV